jgi:hypothetical protein
MIVIPERIVPACLAGAGFAALGMLTGMITCASALAPTKLKIGHYVALCILLLLVGPIIRLIRDSWRAGWSSQKVVEISPRLFSIVCTVCLVVGMTTGVLVAVGFCSH